MPQRGAASRQQGLCLVKNVKIGILNHLMNQIEGWLATFEGLIL